MKIEITKNNLKEVCKRIIVYLLEKKNLPYFNISYMENGSMSWVNFTPVSQNFLAIDDYEKILRILLVHPNIRDLELYEGLQQMFIHMVVYEEDLKK